MSKNANNKSDISKRRSISVVARDVYGTTGSILKWIARDQGRFYGEGGSFPITEEYKQYEHCTQSFSKDSSSPPRSLKKQGSEYRTIGDGKESVRQENRRHTGAGLKRPKLRTQFQHLM